MLPPWVLVASLPYAILVTTVLIGKHIDECDADRAKRIRTLPVILGPELSLFLSRQLMVLFFLSVLCLVMVGTLGVWTLLVFLAVPRLWQVFKVYGKPRPDSAPEDYPVWPLWFVAWAFRLTRQAGGLFVVGLILVLLWVMAGLGA